MKQKLEDKSAYEHFEEDESCAKEQLVFSFPLASFSQVIPQRQHAVSAPRIAESISSRSSSRTARTLGISDSIPSGFIERPGPARNCWGWAKELSCATITLTERCGNKPVDHSHCPIGSLRKEAQRIAAIGLRIALDGIRLRWSRPAQMHYDAAKKTADETLTAWNQHIHKCEICRDAESGLVPDRTDSELVTAPAILLVDDNYALLELLVGILEPTYKIATALSNGAAVVEQAAALLPDVIILDISLGDVSGFEVARRLKKAGCPAKIIFLSLHEDMDFVGAAFGLGASGYVFKSRLTTDLENAIATVLSGGQFSSIR